MGGVRWAHGPVAALAPWDGIDPVAWIGTIAEGGRPALAPSDVDSRDADGMPAAARDGFLSRRLILRRCLARWTGTAPETVVVACDAFRRPVVRAPAGPLAVSTASRDGVMAVALAGHPVGIDVEVVTGRGMVAAAVLTDEEGAGLAALPPGRREAAFLALWTAKEAYLKATGFGLARDPATVAVAHGPAHALTITERGRLIPTRCAQSHCRAVGALAVTAACVVLP